MSHLAKAGVIKIEEQSERLVVMHAVTVVTDCLVVIQMNSHLFVLVQV